MDHQPLSESEIDERVIAVVAAARRKYGIEIGCTGEEAARKVDLRIHRRALFIDSDGLYEDDNRLIILNPRVKWHPRVQFTIYHEIFHYLVLNDDDVIYERLTNLHGANRDSFKRGLEEVCNAGAAEFLAPAAEIRRAIREKHLSVDLVEEIAKTHGTGLVASAIQIGRYAPIDSYVVICEHGPYRHNGQNRTGLRVEYASWPRWGKYRLARYTPIAKDHLFYDAWTSKQSAARETYVPFRSAYNPDNFRKECWGEAKCIGARVLGLLKVVDEVSKDQMALGI